MAKMIKLHLANLYPEDNNKREVVYVAQSQITTLEFRMFEQYDNTKLSIIRVGLSNGDVVKVVESLTDILEQME